MDYNEIVDIIVKTVLDAVYKIVEKLPFDKTTIGVVVKVENNNYTVIAFGREYVIQSKNTFELGERVAVTAPQNDFKHLIMTSL